MNQKTEKPSTALAFVGKNRNKPTNSSPFSIDQTLPTQSSTEKKRILVPPRKRRTREKGERNAKYKPITITANAHMFLNPKKKHGI